MSQSIANAIAELGRAYQFLGLASGEVGLAAVQTPQYNPQAVQIASACIAQQSAIIGLVTVLQAL